MARNTVKVDKVLRPKQTLSIFFWRVHVPECQEFSFNSLNISVSTFSNDHRQSERANIAASGRNSAACTCCLVNNTARSAASFCGAFLAESHTHTHTHTHTRTHAHAKNDAGGRTLPSLLRRTHQTNHTTPTVAACERDNDNLTT